MLICVGRSNFKLANRELVNIPSSNFEHPSNMGSCLQFVQKLTVLSNEKQGNKQPRRFQFKTS